MRHLLSGWLAGISASSRLKCKHLLQLTASHSSSLSGSRESYPEVQLCICPKTCEDSRHFLELFHCTASFSLMSCLQIPATQQPQRCFAWALLLCLQSTRAAKLRTGNLGLTCAFLFSLETQSCTSCFLIPEKGCFFYVLWFCSYL